MERPLPPRVLHIGKYWPPFMGGVETFMADLLPAQCRAGAEVGALVHDHAGGRLPPFERDHGVTIWRVPGFGRLLYAPVSPHFPARLRRVIADFRPDLLHLHTPNTSAFWALLTPAARRLPWVIHWHSDVVASRLDRGLALAYPLYRPFERALLARAGRVIVTSPPYRDSSAALAPWRDRTEVIPLGIDADRLPRPDARARDHARGCWPGGLRLLSIGRLTYYKGHEVLLRALARVPGASLVLVGEGERRGDLERLIGELGIGERVWLAGRIGDAEMAALLAECDLFCLPSIERTEAFGVVLMEAMAQGRPSLVSAIEGSGVGWVVEDGVDGFHLPPGDVEAWAARIDGLVADPSPLRRLGEVARGRFGQRFRIDRVADRTLALYREVLGRGAA